MIKIIKTEFASEFSPIVRTEHMKEIDFYELTNLALTKADFAETFKEHVGEFGNVTSIHDDGKYISVSYDRFNRGILEIYPEPDKKPEAKRITKNLEAICKYANVRGWRVNLKQTDNYKWYGVLFNNHDDRCFIGTDDCQTPYQAVKNVMEDAGLFK
jgi:hypothetical protein